MKAKVEEYVRPKFALPKVGQKVRFLKDNLGASRRDEQTRFIAGEIFGTEDTGVVAFKHPSPRMENWWYVKVLSKLHPNGEPLYVGVEEGWIWPVAKASA